MRCCRYQAILPAKGFRYTIREAQFFIAILTNTVVMIRIPFLISFRLRRTTSGVCVGLYFDSDATTLDCLYEQKTADQVAKGIGGFEWYLDSSTITI